MLFNVYDYSNQVLGQVEAAGDLDAWTKAREKFTNILDVRRVEVPEVEAVVKKGVEDVPLTAKEIAELATLSGVSAEEIIEEMGKR
ncbi:unnamed protein product [marine sediment metagenome]|uniref:Uncharacterized protein n=1 Tax=marine sediment metagenome TaxID=412755 RepID=X1UE08_9ZZZZ